MVVQLRCINMPKKKRKKRISCEEQNKEMFSQQSTHRLLMIRPNKFGFNHETASSNAFQNDDQTSNETISDLALKEFDAMVEKLRSNDLEVDVFHDTESIRKPDAIFPNNWLSTHADGTIVVYPMMAENRREERRNDIIDWLKENFRVNTVIDLSSNERRGFYLEGTGSLVLDRLNRVVYASESVRTDSSLVQHLTNLIQYKTSPIIFQSFDEEKRPIYHTNVMLTLTTDLAVVCLQAIEDLKQRQCLIESLRNRTILSLSHEQMKEFAGNMLEVVNRRGEKYLLMSKRADQSLTDEQREKINGCQLKTLVFDVSTIEKYGGGSVRCMICENFLEYLLACPLAPNLYKADAQL